MNWVNDLKTASAWEGHCNFARDFVKEKGVKSVVELGTYGGHSLFSFAQGMKDAGVKGRLVAIDTWAGDKNMGAYDGDQIMESVKSVATRYFPELDFKFIRKTFNDARVLVANSGFDLLHIDGSHDYESVKEDFENYAKKVKKGGYIFMHDTQVMDRGFGVSQFFNELKELHPEWEFSERPESYGLGIIKT